MKQPFIIGIAGGSAGGKSTVTRKVIEATATKHTAVIVQDNYYRYQSDHPHAFDWALMVEHLNDLRHGVPIKMPQYNYTQHTRAAQIVTVAPPAVIVLEGVFALYDADLRDTMHNQFIEPTKRFADVILPHGANEPAVDMITARISSLIAAASGR